MKLHGNYSECPKCGERFNSLKAFDRHRWEHGACRTPASMIAIGMGKNGSGFWISYEPINGANYADTLKLR